MAVKAYRGYILCRLSKIGSEWDIVAELQKINKDLGKELKVTYASPIYGAWDLIIEVSFVKLEELDKLVTLIRTNPKLQTNIEETTTFVSSRPDYPWD
jgi:DNA-binding Lrp family transcriptional regulator